MGKVNSFNISSLILSLSGCSFFGISTSYILYKSNTSTLISMLIGFAFSFLYVFVYLKFFSTLPKYSFALKMKKIFGKFSVVINIICMICALLLFAAFNYRISKFLSSQYLIDTPPIYLNFFIGMLIAYMATKKVEAVSRVSIVSFFICLIIFLLDLMALIPEVEITRLLPIMTVSNENILISGLVFSIFFSMPCFFINIINKDNIVNKEKFNKSFLKVYGLAFIVLLIIVFMTIGILGINLTNILSYPLYSVLKRINVSSFIISIENVSIVLWFLFEIVGSAAMLLFTFSSMKDTFNIRKEKIVNIIGYTLAVLCIFIPNYVFNQSLINTSFKMLIMPGISLIVLFIICLISLIVYNVRKKKIN